MEKNDVDENINISIIRYLPRINPRHYCVQISSKSSALGNNTTSPIHEVTRSLVITPQNSKNLETFLAN